jgi:hypothetical protein
MSPSEPAASPSGWTPPPPPQPFAAGQGQANGLAIGSLVCGALSILCLGFLLGIPAIIMGFMQLKKISADPANYGGKGLAIGGIVTGAIGTLLSLLGVIIWIILLATGGRF